MCHQRFLRIGVIVTVVAVGLDAQSFFAAPIWSTVGAAAVLISQGLVLGDFDNDALAVQTALVKMIDPIAHFADELFRRFIDADLEVSIKIGLPQGNLIDRLFEYPIADVGYQVGFFRNGDEFPRINGSPFRVLPADQSFGFVYVAGF